MTPARIAAAMFSSSRLASRRAALPWAVTSVASGSGSLYRPREVCQPVRRERVAEHVSEYLGDEAVGLAGPHAIEIPGAAASVGVDPRRSLLMLEGHRVRDGDDQDRPSEGHWFDLFNKLQEATERPELLAVLRRDEDEPRPRAGACDHVHWNREACP